MKNLVSSIGQIFSVLAFLVMIPVLLPVGMIAHALQERKMRQAVDSFKCLGCGKTLGAESIALSNEEWSKYMKENNEFELSSRIIRSHHAICSQCKMKYKYNDKEKTFDAVV